MGKLLFRTGLGEAYVGDSLDFLRSLPEESVDLVVTSPPFPLLRQKEYGNPSAEEYLNWFLPYATEMRRVLKPTGSLVLDLGGAWKPGLPVREIYGPAPLGE